MCEIIMEKKSKYGLLRVELKKKIKGRELIVAPGSHGPLYTKLIERAGFGCVYMTGFGTVANVLGMPDVGLITMSEMVANLKNMCNVVDIPVLADMDTGYGNAINVMRTVNEYEMAGAAGFHIEDQVTPKRCGFMQGKMLVPMEDMVGKIGACVEARMDENMLIIARTDARAVEGNEAMWERANAYVEAGADVVFPERPESFEDIKGDLTHIKAPLLLNGIRPQYGVKTVEEIRKLGFSILIMPGATWEPAMRSAYDFLVHVKKTGTYPDHLDGPVNFFTRSEFAEIIGLTRIREYEEKFLPKEEIRERYRSKTVPREF
jgi:2-methylisocitrate lyase-like PEP mutase family enzyme